MTGTPERRREIERIFEAALERPVDDRAGYLAAACGDDAELLSEVGALLAAHAMTEGVLERDPLRALDHAAAGPGPGAMLGDHRLVREIGRGGMAVVYLAHDVRHDRPVALKLLHPGLAALVGRERFRREIRLAARLQHPRILPLYDSGETEHGVWYTMPYIEGETLRARIRRDRRLPEPEAVEIALAVAGALEHAHKQGVIHRDVKPENLLLARHGGVRVADFGIGRAFDASSTDVTLTRSGILVGTPAYMSPEQARGDRELDGRTDIYSLGCVLYEMIAGEPPFAAPTPQAIIARHLGDPVPSLRDTLPEVPAALDATVRRALAKHPADRFAGAAEFAAALGPGQSRTWWRGWSGRPRPGGRER